MSDVPADDYRIVTPDRFWGFWRLLLQRPFTWFFRMRVYGAEHVPRTGPAVIASNHIAGIDVVVLGAASPRTLRYMAKAELFTYNRVLDLDAAPRRRLRRAPRRVRPRGAAARAARPAAPGTRSASSARARASRRRRSAACSPARR